jgi:stage IV sporulation protein FB
MGKSVLLAKIFGTRVRMHPTFLLLLGWIALGQGLTRGPGAAVTGVAFVLLLFACVVAHEFGHVLVARRFGGRTRDIILLPIGGVSRMETMPERPAEELAVAVAGPMVSLLIGLVLLLLVGLPTAKMIESPGFDSLLPRLAAANLFLALFNLVPAFPMDGGRALRALLSIRFGRLAATGTSARLGHLIAGLFVVYGLVSANALLLLIGIFIYFGASAEAAGTEFTKLAQKLTVAEAMCTDVAHVSANRRLADAVAAMVGSGQHVLAIWDCAGRPIGIVTKDGLIRALHRFGWDGIVAEAREQKVATISATQPLSDALRLMESSSAPVLLAVAGDGNLIGVVTRESLADLFMMERAAPEYHPLPTAGLRPRRSVMPVQANG